MSSLNAPTPIITTYAELRQAIAARRKELGLSQLALDEIAGTQSGYVAKVEAAIKNFGPMSFEAILGALGLSMLVVRTAPAQPDMTGVSAICAEKAKIHRKKIGAMGGRATARNLNADQRRAAARHAAKTRWRNWRQVKAEKAARERRAKKKAAAEAPPS